LVTGYDILNFWVSRMLFQCSYIDNSVSLKNVVLHGLIRDSQNRKMSKSLGNVVDPMDVIGEFGADAFRSFLMSSTPNSAEDIRYDETKLKYYSSFINKL
jgi:valyl-tRNA synthetase